MLDWLSHVNEDPRGPNTVMPQDRVLAELRRRLDEGVLRPGDRLAPERLLAQELDVSRAILRGALAVLDAEGRIWRGVGKGTFVGGPRVDSPGHVPDIAGLTSPAEVMEVRLALEPTLARLAAHRASGRELDEVETCSEKAASASSQATYEAWDGRMHHAIATAAHNRLFLALFEAMNAVRDHTTWGQAREARRSSAWHRSTHEQHARIVVALRERDAVRADCLMIEHLRAVREQLLGPSGGDARSLAAD